jgi:hypothetical protein
VSVVTADQLNTSRRQFLKLGFFGALALPTISATALLSGCSTPPAAQGFRLLRENDLTVLRALLPVVLAGELPADAADMATAREETLHTLDDLLFCSSRATHKQVGQLFDLLSMPVTRYTVAGLSDAWDKTSPEAITQFLEKWRHSRLQTLRAGYLALMQIINMAWYFQPRSWATIGYEPLHVVA